MRRDWNREGKVGVAGNRFAGPTGFFASLRMTAVLASLFFVEIRAETVVDFEGAEVAKRVEAWEENGVTFKLAHAPVQTKAVGRLVFFEHHGTGRKGILCAMAMEPIPVEVRFSGPVSSVAVVFWASTGSAARLEAFDAAGQRVAEAVQAVVPGRSAPEEQVPFFELKVQGPEIALVRFSGPRAGEFLAADEVRFEPVSRR